MSDHAIKSILWTLVLWVSMILLSTWGSGCISTGKSALLPWNWNLGDAKPKQTDPNFDKDSQKILGIKLTYEALQRLSFVVPLALGAIVLGTVVMFAGHGIGMKILGAGFVGLTVYFGIVQYTQWIALLGFLGVLSIMGYILFIKSRGWKETIGSVDVLLEQFPEQAKEMIGILKGNQKHKTTRNLVKKISSTLKYVPGVPTKPIITPPPSRTIKEGSTVPFEETML